MAGYGMVLGILSLLCSTVMFIMIPLLFVAPFFF